MRLLLEAGADIEAKFEVKKWHVRKLYPFERSLDCLYLLVQRT